MRVFSSKVVKIIIALLAVINIIAMLGFEYGLPALAGDNNEIISNPNDNKPEVGTIEAVEQETASKEAKAAENALAKTDTEEEYVNDKDDSRDPDAPILELTDDHIYLKVGDRFNYMSYIETMRDVDGSDLSRYIYLDKDVDTSEPGEIELTYRITSVITGKSDSKVLLITIQE